jgi:hypothetical protein
MKYKILRTDGDFDFHNNSTITELPEGAIALTDVEWKNRLEPSNAQKLVNAKNSKLAQLDKNRNDFCLVPMEFEGNTFAATSEAKTAIISLANSLATLATAVGYPSYPEDDLISLTKANFKSIESLIQTREFTSRETRRDLKAQINACTTIEQVNAININF